MELGKHSLGTSEAGKAVLGCVARVERPDCISRQHRSRQHRRMLFRNKSTNSFDLIATDLADWLAMVDLRSLDVRLHRQRYVRVRDGLPNYRFLASCSTKAIRCNYQWNHQYGGHMESDRWDGDERWFVHSTILGGNLQHNCYQCSRFDQIILRCCYSIAAHSSGDY